MESRKNRSIRGWSELGALRTCLALAMSLVPTGASAAIPGLSGTTCGLECVEYLRSLVEFENVFETITPNLVYVDSYSGDDANDGSAGSPIRSFALAKRLWATHGNRIKFRNGQVWSPLVFEPTAGISTCIAGEAVTAGAKSAEILDVDAAAGVIVFHTTDPASGDLTTAETITGVTSGCTLSLAGSLTDTIRTDPISSGTQDTASCVPTEGIVCDSAATFQSDGVQAGDCLWNSQEGPFATVLNVTSETRMILASGLTGNSAGDAYVVYRACAGELAKIDGAPGFDDRIVSLMEAEDPLGEPPEIHCNGQGIGGAERVAGGVFAVGGDGLGIAGAQNFRVRSCNADVVSQHLSAKVIALRIDADEIGNDTGTVSNNCTTSHQDGMVGTLNSVCRSKPTSNTAGATIAPTGICNDDTGTFCGFQSHQEPEAFLWDIGSRFTMDLSEMNGGHVVMSSTGANVMLLETEMVCDGAGSGYSCGGPDLADGNRVPSDAYKVYLARTTVDVTRGTQGSVHCVSFDNRRNGGAMIYSLYNVTLGAEGDCNRLIQIRDGVGPTRVVGRNLILQESEPCGAPEDGLVYALAGQASHDSIDLQGIHGSDECWVFDGVDPGNTAAVHAAAQAVNPASSFFQVGSTFDPDDQFGGDPIHCDPEQSCFNGATEPWTIPFSSLHASNALALCLKDVVDGEICAFSGGTGNAGSMVLPTPPPPPPPSVPVGGAVPLAVILVLIVRRHMLTRRLQGDSPACPGGS